MQSLSIIILASFLGVLVSVFLHYVRRTIDRREHTSCPPYYDCHLVVGSKYANFFQIPVELLGVFYYVFIFVLYSGMAVFPVLNIQSLALFSLLLSTIAFLFSIYLTAIQLITLRRICVWCIVSAFLSAVIFLGSLSVSSVDLVPFLAEHSAVILMVHLLGFALGVGGATMTDLFFFRFLRDYHISKSEASVLHHVSQLIWIGLVILIISGLGLYLPNAVELNASGKFIAKMFVVAIVIANGIFLNLFLSPKLIQISFGRKHHHRKGELLYLRRAAFASGAVSIVSWYTAFVLGTIKQSPWAASQILFDYFLILLAAIAISQVVERWYDTKSRIGS